MYKEITLRCANGEEKPFKFLSTGTTAYRYSQIFKQDLMRIIAKMSQLDDTTDYSVSDKLAYIMNSQAEGKDMKMLNMDTFLDWIEQLDSNAIFLHVEEIFGLYIGSKLTNANLKKEELPQSAS